jgi:membrane-anchored protein YejM (alkaline phosphatase superfamily)
MHNPRERMTAGVLNPHPWREWAWLYVVNCAFTLIIQSGYVLGLSTGLTGPARFGFAMAYVSQAGFLNLFPALLTAWPLRHWRQKTFARLFAGALYAVLQVSVLADIVIFRLFQRHFDSLIWNVLTTKGAGDSVRVNAVSVLTAAAAVLAVIGISMALALRVARGLVVCRLRLALMPLLIALLTERATLAMIDLWDNSAMQTVRDTLPLYEPLRIQGLAKSFGYKRPPGEVRVLPLSSGSLDIPKHPLGFGPEARTPNIIVMAIEGGRADSLDDKAMPYLSVLARDSFRLMKHFSTGNETRFGIFGLLYGLPATYWSRVLAQNMSPPWLDLLATRGYEFQILSCTDLNYPEFRQTAFVKLAASITDHWNAPHRERDRLMTDRFLGYLSDRASHPNPSRPFFGFLFFDASHQPYEHPPEDDVFESRLQSSEINYAKLAVSPAAAQALKGSYLDSLHYIDREIGRILKALQDTGEFQRTIIIIVGDHGEEFGEVGHFGHTSSFNRFQTQTFGVMHLPGEPPRIVDHLTSHASFVPSVLTWMGVTNALEDYTTELPIQGTDSHQSAVIAGWSNSALVKEDSITVFKQYRTLYLDKDYQELPKDDPRRLSARETLQALNQMRAFLK